MTKYIYASKVVRVKIRTKTDFIGIPIIELRLEVRKWYGWIRCSSSWDIDIELRADYIPADVAIPGGREMYRRNPMILDYQMGGKREIWDRGTLFISLRAEALGKLFLQARGTRDKNLTALRSKLDQVG